MTQTDAHQPSESWRPEYRYIEECEHLSLYCKGGYHVVNINDRLSERYKIIDKLGYGGYSTAWLARDEETEKNVAVKIMIAESDGARECSILSSLKPDAHDPAEPGQESIPALLDEFTVSGSNGKHHCLVTEPARASLRDMTEAGDNIPLQSARVIIAQLVQAVAYLHSKCIVHGDLNLGNILLKLPDAIMRMTTKELYDAFGEPSTEPIKRFDGSPLSDCVPQMAVIPAWLWLQSEKPAEFGLESAQILLTDFGQSFMVSASSTFESCTPLELRPPEHLTGQDRALSYASDIWALACDIFRVLGNRTFIERWFMDEDRALADQVELLGRLPDELWDSWAGRSKSFTEDMQRIDGKARGTFRDRMEFCIGDPRRKYGGGELSEEETQALEDLLRSMMALDKRDRISADEALKSTWMVKWALPDLERAKKIWEAEERKLVDQHSSTDKTTEQVQVESQSQAVDAGHGEIAGDTSGKQGLVEIKEAEDAEDARKDEMPDR